MNDQQPTPSYSCSYSSDNRLDAESLNWNGEHLSSKQRETSPPLESYPIKYLVPVLLGSQERSLVPKRFADGQCSLDVR